MTKQTKTHIRQGDVLLTTVSALPPGCVEVPHDKGRIVLAYGEVTGHAHAIADHRVTRPATPGAAAEIAEAAIARVKARLLKAPSGERSAPPGLEGPDQLPSRSQPAPLLPGA